MAAFEFELEKVLDIRNLRERLAENELQQARRQLQKLKTQKQNLISERNNIYNYLRQGNLSLQENIQAREFISIKNEKLEETKALIQEQRQEVSRCQENLIDKRKHRRVLENLKEQKFQEFKDDFMKSQQKIIDEIGQRSAGAQEV